MNWQWTLPSGERIAAVLDRSEERVLLDEAEVVRMHRSTHRREHQVALPERTPAEGEAPFRSGGRAQEVLVAIGVDGPELLVDGAVAIPERIPTRSDRLLTAMGPARFVALAAAVLIGAFALFATSAPGQWLYGRMRHGGAHASNATIALDAAYPDASGTFVVHAPRAFATATDGSLFVVTNGASVAFVHGPSRTPATSNVPNVFETPLRALALTTEVRHTDHAVYGPDSQRMIHVYGAGELAMDPPVSARTGDALCRNWERAPELEANAIELGVPLYVRMCRIYRDDEHSWAVGLITPAGATYRDDALFARIVQATELKPR